MSSSIQGAFVETGCKLYPVFETHRERDRLTKTKEAQKVEKRLLHRESGAGFRYLDGVKRQGHVFQSEGSQTRKPFEQEEMIARRRLARAGRAPGLRSAGACSNSASHDTRAQRIGRPLAQALNPLSLCATVKGESRL